MEDSKSKPEDIELDPSDEAIGRVMIAYTVLEKLLVAKGIVTEEEIKSATKQVIQQFAEATRKLQNK